MTFEEWLEEQVGVPAFPARAGWDAAIKHVMPELVDVVKGFMQLIDDNVLVRNIEGDGDPSWAVKCLPLVLTVQKAQAALAGVKVKE